jgi:hypothetical protein
MTDLADDDPITLADACELAGDEAAQALAIAINDLRKKPEQTATDLYRHFDAEGCLLYVGISLNAIARLAVHTGRVAA